MYLKKGLRKGEEENLKGLRNLFPGRKRKKKEEMGKEREREKEKGEKGGRVQKIGTRRPHKPENNKAKN